MQTLESERHIRSRRIHEFMAAAVLQDPIPNVVDPRIFSSHVQILCGGAEEQCCCREQGNRPCLAADLLIGFAEPHPHQR